MVLKISLIYKIKINPTSNKLQLISIVFFLNKGCLKLLQCLCIPVGCRVMVTTPPTIQELDEHKGFPVFQQ